MTKIYIFKITTSRSLYTYTSKMNTVLRVKLLILGNIM